jgi:16S rRNA C967 or C1407 C5-methylase (RsmB/RsmF family)
VAGKLVLPLRKERFPRDAAVKILGKVWEGGTWEEAWLEYAHKSHHPESSAAWLYEITGGALRNGIRLGFWIDQMALAKRPSGKIRKALTLAAYALLEQESSAEEGLDLDKREARQAHIVSEWVEWIKQEEGVPPAKFGNAILRGLLRNAEEFRKSEPQVEDPIEVQAALASLPLEVWQKFLKSYGLEEARRLAREFRKRPSTWMRDRLSPTPQAVRWEGVGLPDLEEGRFYVQDWSGVELLRRVGALQTPDQKDFRRALDFCAAPGGKAFGLWDQGWEVTAYDSNEVRLKVLEMNYERLKKTHVPGARAVFRWTSDASEVKSNGPYDLVWVDPPCTASGLLRRHPEMRYRKETKKLLEYQTLQKSLLKEGARHLRVGGYLIYSVCSLFSEEIPHLEGLKELESVRLGPPEGDGFLAKFYIKESEGT